MIVLKIILKKARKKYFKYLQHSVAVVHSHIQDEASSTLAFFMFSVRSVEAAEDPSELVARFPRWRSSLGTSARTRARSARTWRRSALAWRRSARMRCRIARTWRWSARTWCRSRPVWLVSSTAPFLEQEKRQQRQALNTILTVWHDWKVPFVVTVGLFCILTLHKPAPKQAFCTVQSYHKNRLFAPYKAAKLKGTILCAK